MKPNFLSIFNAARMFVLMASLVDFFAIYLGASMPLENQWGKTPTVARLAVALGVCAGLTDMLAVNLFYGPEIIKRVPFCSRRHNHPSDLPTLIYVPIPEIESGLNTGPPALIEDNKTDHASSFWKKLLTQGIYPPISALKSFLDHTYFLSLLFSWISTWSQVGSENAESAITTSLIKLVPWQMAVIGTTYLLGVFPLYATAEIQETSNKLNTLMGQPQHLSPLRNIPLFKTLTTEVCPYVTPLVKNLPQLAFFSPHFLWGLMGSYGGFCLISLYAGLWVKNVMTTFQMVRNFEVQTARVNLGMETNKTPHHVSRVARLFWGSSQNMERSIAFVEETDSLLGARSVGARAAVIFGSIAVACLPVYALSLAGEDNSALPDAARTTPRTTPSSESPKDHQEAGDLKRSTLVHSPSAHSGYSLLVPP